MTNWGRVLRKWEWDAAQLDPLDSPGLPEPMALVRLNCKFQGVQGLKHRRSLSQTVSK